MKRWLIPALVATLLLASVGGGYWLLATQSGLQTSIKFAQKVVAGLTIGEASGRLYDGLILENIRFAPAEGPEVQIDEIDGQWQLWSILSGRLIVSQLHISKLQISLPEGKDAPVPEDQELFQLALPVGLHIRSLRINDATLTPFNGEPIPLFDRLDTALRLSHDRLTVSSFNVIRPDFAATMVGDVQFSGAYRTNLNYGLNINHPQWGKVDVTATLSGDMHRMTLHQQIGEPLASEQIIIMSDLLTDPKWRLLIEGDSWTLGQLLEGQAGHLQSFNVSGHGDFGSAQLELETDITELHPELPPLYLKTRLNSDDLQNWLVDSHLKIDKSAEVDISGSMDITNPENPQFALTGRWQSLSWPLLKPTKIVDQSNGQISLIGTLQAYQLQLNSQSQVYDEKLSMLMSAVGDLQKISVSDMQLQHAAGEMQIEGDFQWAETLQYSATANWQDIQVPKDLSPKSLTISNGNLTLSGDISQFKAQLDSNVDFDNQPYQIRLRADSPQMLNANIKFDLQLPEGAAGFAGEVALQDKFATNGRLTLRQFNPQAFANEWPGLISGQADFSFKQPSDSLREIKLRDLALTGQLRDRQFKLNADADMVNESLMLPRFNLQAGSSELRISGQLQPDIAAKWQINSPDLSDFMPDLSGELTASGDLAGDPSALRLLADINGNNIAYNDMAVGQLQGQANLDFSGEKAGELSLSATNMQLAGQPLDSLTINLTGQRDRQQFNAELQSAILNLQITADGGMNGDMWQGQFSEFTIENPDAGRWLLTKKARLNLSAQSQTLPRHCWQSVQGEICLQVENTDDQGWQTAGRFKALPISLLESFYRDFAKLSGDLQGEFSLAVDSAQNYTGSGQIDLQRGEVQLTGDGFRQAQSFRLKTLNLQYQLDADKSALALTLAPDISGVSPLEARLQMPPLKQVLLAPMDSQIALQLQTAIEDLSELDLAHPAVEDLQGTFNADIDINGTVKKPQINSMLSLRDAEVALTELGIILKDLNVDLSGDPQSGINFLLQGTSAQGPLEIDGEFLLADDGWQLAAMIKGDKVLLMNLPEAYVIASPDLQLEMTAEAAKLRGKLSIPEARLEPMQFNMAVSPSKDVVVINEPQPEASILETDIDIIVSLGDKVEIRAAGFQGNLKGDLAVTGDAGELLLADGEITLKDGSYVAYGRELKVDNGKIRFSGGAIDNPDLDVRAVRELTDVTAGIHLTGPVDNPQAALFSIPSMSQDNILSYILIGRPLNEANSGDGAMLASAATSLGIQNGNALSDQISSTFGLDSVAFTGDSPETAAVEIGKYLSPRLYIGYGIGVLEPVSTVQMRYELSKIWTLQAESGTESGVDLLYIFER